MLKIGVVSEKINSPQVPSVKAPPRQVVALSVDPWPGVPAPLVPPPDIRTAEGHLDPSQGQEAQVGGLLKFRIYSTVSLALATHTFGIKRNKELSCPCPL